jgi:hypothetical protein
MTQPLRDDRRGAHHEGAQRSPRAGHHAAGLVGTPADSASLCYSRVSVHRVGNAPGDRCSAIELSCEMVGAVVRTDTDKNAALCSATSTSPVTRSTMKLSRIISRAERAR